MKIDEKLSEVFNIEPMEQTEIVTKDGEIINETTNKIEADYEITRNNLRQLLTDGQSALQNALEVAKQSEHPRAFEVVGNLMKQLADINQQLLDLHQQKQKLDSPKDEHKKEVTNNNAIFVGSTADLNKLIKNMTKGE
jgi:uncharacterized protein (DUF3084 family)